MRNISLELQANLDTGATHMCRCWLLKRKDGAQFGFTDHDRDITFDGTIFQAESGLDSSVMESTTGLSVDNGQAIGALSSIGLTEGEIMGGKFDGAEVWQWKVDWRNPDLRLLLFRGFLGEIRRGQSVFEAELRGVTELLNQPLGRIYMRECDRVLGDGKCRVDISGSAAVTIQSVEQQRQFGFTGLESYAENWFADGVIEWVTGANAGAISVIKSDLGTADRLIESTEEVRMTIAIGDQVRLIAGCDKTAKTCRVKFNNFRNFRGFPHMPGEDWVTTYPTGNSSVKTESISAS